MSISQELHDLKEHYIQLEYQILELLQKQTTLIELVTEILTENKTQKQVIKNLEEQIHLVSEPKPKQPTIIIRPWKTLL